MELPQDLSPFETYLLHNGYTFQGSTGLDKREFRDAKERLIETQRYRTTWIPVYPGLGFRINSIRGQRQKPRGLTYRETYRLMRVVDFRTIVNISKTSGHHVLAHNESFYLVHRHPWHHPANRTLLNL